MDNSSAENLLMILSSMFCFIMMKKKLDNIEWRLIELATHLDIEDDSCEGIDEDIDEENSDEENTQKVFLNPRNWIEEISEKVKKE